MKVCFSALLSVSLATVALAQDTRPKFDIAAIRPNIGGRGTQVLDGQGDGGRFSATNITLRQLIAWAYHLQATQISGGPAWINTARFDVEAKPEEGVVPTPEETQEMLQTLLEDRFQLKVKDQTKPGPVYALVVAKGGPKIKLSADQTPPPAPPQGLRPGRGGFRGGGPGGGPPGGPAGRPAAGRGGGGGFQGARGGGAGAGAATATAGTPAAGAAVPAQGDRPPGAAGGPRRALDRPMPRGQVMMGPGLLRGSAVTMEQLTRPMGNQLGRPVLDQTKLSGLYDVQLTFAPIQNGVLPNNSFRQDGPVIFTAIQEQLGLKLESTTGPIETLLVEKAEEPGEN